MLDCHCPRGIPSTKKKGKKSCPLLVSPLSSCEASETKWLSTSLPKPCFMFHVRVVSSCSSDSPGSCLNLCFICKQCRPPTHGCICNNGGCVVHGPLLLCCGWCFARCIDGLNSAEYSSNQSESLKMKISDLNSNVYHHKAVCMCLSVHVTVGCSISTASVQQSLFPLNR